MNQILTGWIYQASTKTVRVMPQNYMLASFAAGSFGSDGAVKAHAGQIGPLMAAAPDMLAALETLTSAAARMALTMPENQLFAEVWDATIAAREAIAKAEGRS